MLRAAWKSVVGRKLRLLLSAFSIVLGIAFVAGSLIFTNLLSASFDGIFKGTIADVNVQAESSSRDFSEPGRPIQGTLPPDLVADVGEVDGVEDATGTITSMAVYPLDKDGRILAFGGAPGIAGNFHTSPAAGGIEGIALSDGRAPEADDEVTVDPGTLSRGGYAIGDEIEIATPLDGIQSYTITGSATYGAGATGGASYLFFTDDEAQRILLEGQDAYTSIWITVTPDADVEAVTDAVDELLPEGFEAVSGEVLAEELEETLDVGLAFVNTFLLVFAAIALIVATLLILNTFSILVAQRSRELALLRALGATRPQVRNSVLFEAVIVGTVGATLGILAGWGLAFGIAAVMNATGLDIGTSAPELTWQAVVVSYVLGIVITLVAAWLPARRASSTRPVEAMTQAASGGPQELLGTGVMIGLALIQLGAAGIVCGLWFNVPGPSWWVGIGCAAVLIGMVMAAAVVGMPVVWLFGRLYRAVFGEVGKMAELNARRQPRRTAATAATLMIGLSLVTAVAILASSTTTSLREGLTEDQRGDFLISPVNFRPFDAAVAERAADVDGVEAVWTFARSGTSIDGTPVAIVGTSPEGVTDGTALDVLAGHLNPEDNSVLLDHDLSQELDLPMGRTFELPTTSGGTIELLVTGIFDAESVSTPLGDLIVNLTTYPELGDATVVDQVIVEASDGADPQTVREGLLDATSELPTVTVTDNDEFADSLVSQFDQAFAVLYALLALAIVISVLGIVNTLGLSVFERTREIGLLRAVGMTRPQMRRLVTLESVIVAVLGSVLGVVLGLVFGSVLVEILRDSGITHLVIPGVQLAVFVVVAALFGVIAAFTPARRAARLNILDAIAMD